MSPYCSPACLCLLWFVLSSSYHSCLWYVGCLFTTWWNCLKFIRAQSWSAWGNEVEKADVMWFKDSGSADWPSVWPQWCELCSNEICKAPKIRSSLWVMPELWSLSLWLWMSYFSLSFWVYQPGHQLNPKDLWKAGLQLLPQAQGIKAFS